MSPLLNSELESMIARQGGWCTIEKARDLAVLVEERNPALICESGIFAGRSLFAFALALKHVGHGVAWGVDPWSVDAALEGEKSRENIDWWSKNVVLEDVYKGFVRAAVDLDLLHCCSWIRGKGEDAARFFKDGSLDIFHLDSNHSELVSCREVETWAPKMAKNSVWIMDDSDWASQAKAIDMIKANGFRVLWDRKTYMAFER
jgi:Methyltransferase domain